MKKVFVPHHSIQFLDRRKFTRPNINALIEEWMQSDMFWAPRFTCFEYVMRTKGSEKYIYSIIELKEFWSTIKIPDLYENLKNGSGNRTGYRRKTRIFVWSLCQIEIKKEKRTID